MLNIMAGETNNLSVRVWNYIPQHDLWEAIYLGVQLLRGLEKK